MSERFRAYSAIVLMLSRQGKNGEEILLQKRKDTGYRDGFYDFGAGGHVEDQESMKDAVVREAKEELNIEIKKSDNEFICIIHKNVDDIYYNGYFKVTKWKGEPIINEPEKNEELKWISINNLPDNIIEDRKQAIENYKNNIKYSEFGWDNK